MCLDARRSLRTASNRVGERGRTAAEKRNEALRAPLPYSTLCVKQPGGYPGHSKLQTHPEHMIASAITCAAPLPRGLHTAASAAPCASQTGATAPPRAAQQGTRLPACMCCPAKARQGMGGAAAIRSKTQRRRTRLQITQRTIGHPRHACSRYRGHTRRAERGSSSPCADAREARIVAMYVCE